MAKQLETRTVVVPNNEYNQGNSNVSPTGWLVGRYRKIKEHAETYPYVWGSYIVAYGGFALWYAYRWRKLSKMEDRVRSVQKRLRELGEVEESSGSAERTPTSANLAENTSSSPEKLIQ